MMTQHGQCVAMKKGLTIQYNLWYNRREPLSSRMWG